MKVLSQQRGRKQTGYSLAYHLECVVSNIKPHDHTLNTEWHSFLFQHRGNIVVVNVRK